MPLSNFWTVQKVWDEIMRDMTVPVNSEPFVQRISIVDRCQKYIVSLFYDLVGQLYMRRVTSLSVSSTVIESDDITNTSFAVATKQLTIYPVSSMLSSDLGKTVVFWTGAASYMGTIVGIVSANIVAIDGPLIPTADVGAANITGLVVLPTAVSAASLSIESYGIAAVGQQIRIDLESSETEDVRALSLPEYKKFDTSSQGNRNTIGYSLQGKTLFLKKGTDLSSYGTLTIWYPGVPATVTSLTDYVDLLDGAPVELAILYGKKLVRERLNVPPVQETAEIERSVRSLYRTYSQEADAQEIEEKVKSLK